MTAPNQVTDHEAPTPAHARTKLGVRAVGRVSSVDLLDNLPTAVVGGPQPLGDPQPPFGHEPVSGTLVGRYLIVEHVGSGGLGDVYKAYDPELDRRIAIKLLRAEVVEANRRLGDPTDRLRREAQALAKLHHPNVVAVYDVGTFDGAVFIAMEFAQGLTLLPWAKAQGHNWRTIRDVFVQAGEGLAAAHDAGLVHRDFKPANVVVGDDGHVTVLDFGLARAADRAQSNDPDGDSDLDARASMASLLSQEVTGGGLLLGTPPYMAPELFDSQPATQHSDQFAFCVALYRVLFNRLPFKASSPRELCKAVADGNLNFAGNNIPGWLQRVLARGLRTKPTERFATMRALLAALQTDRRRRRLGWLGLSILVPLAGVGTAIGAWALRPPPTAAERAVTERLSTESRAAAARGLYVHPPLDDPQAVTALAKVLELEALDGAIAPQAKALGKTLRVEFSEALIRLGDRYYERDGGAPFAADFYATALVFTPDNQHATGRVALSDAQLATLVRQAESQSFSDRQLAAAQPLAILASESPGQRDEKLRRFLARDRTTPARTRTMLAGLVHDDPTPTTSPPPPLTAAPTAADLEPITIAAPTVDVDEVLLEPDALAERKPSEATRAATPKADKGRAASEAKLGTTALAKGNLPQAASHFHRALERDRRNLAALKGLAELHYERGQYAKAIAFGERARTLRPRSKRILLLIGDAHFKTLAYAAARKAYQRAKEVGAKQADERLKRLAARLGK